MKYRIVLLHVVAVAMGPVAQAFEELWPDAETVNLLDDALSRDRAMTHELTPAVAERIRALARYAESLGAHGILYTCSAFGPAIEAVARELTIPVLKPNEAIFEQALAAGRRVGLLATFAPSVASMEKEFEALARLRGSPMRIESVCIPEAMAALSGGDGERHDRLVAEGASRLAHCDAIMLAQFSTARAREAVRHATARPVLTSPHAAVELLRRHLASTKLAK